MDPNKNPALFTLITAWARLLMLADEMQEACNVLRHLPTPRARRWRETWLAIRDSLYLLERMTEILSGYADGEAWPEVFARRAQLEQLAATTKEN